MCKWCIAALYCKCACAQKAMLNYSCQSFVPDWFWFSDSADWMWPCDPWLPGKAWWCDGYSGYGWGEPTTEDYPRSQWYASFMCGCLFMCLIRPAVGTRWLTWCDCREEKEENDSQVCHGVVSSVSVSSLTFKPGTCPFLLIKSFRKISILPDVCVVRVWWKPLSACSETESMCWGCTHHGCPSSFYDGFEASFFLCYLLCSKKQMNKGWRFGNQRGLCV